MFIINFCLNMFRVSLCPSSGDQRPCYCIRCTALVLLDVVCSGCGALRCRMRAVLNMFRASLCPSSGEQRPCVTAYRELRWFCWMWLVAVVGRCVVGCEQCSTCFGHHYAHLQENKDRVTAHTVYCSGSAGCGW